MTEMVNFILRVHPFHPLTQCCGCTFEIRPEDVDDEDNIIDTLAEIQEAYKKVSSLRNELTQTNPREYPLIATKKTSFRKFPKRLAEFFRRLLTKLSNKGMLDVEPSVLDKIQQWVFSLSSTNFRPFRHTATVISLGFITTLCDIYAKINSAHTSSNVAIEKERKGKKQARLKEIERMLEEQESQLKVLTELMESTYDRYPL
jgi:cohesin complex subunit SA-1/2